MRRTARSLRDRRLLAAGQDPRSLSSNQIRTLYLDPQGVLWVGTWAHGLNRYDAETESFTRYNPSLEN